MHVAPRWVWLRLRLTSIEGRSREMSEKLVLTVLLILTTLKEGKQIYRSSYWMIESFRVHGII